MKNFYPLKKNLLTFLFLFYTVFLNAQNNKVFDSIKMLLFNYQFGDPDRAIRLSNSLLDTAQSTKPFIYMTISTSYWSKGNKEKSIVFLELSKNTAEMNNDPGEYVKAILGLAEKFVKMGLNGKAKNYLASGSEKIKQVKNVRSKVLLQNYIDILFAEICINNEDYNCAIDLYKKINLSFQKVKVGKDEASMIYTINQNLAVGNLCLSEIYTTLKDIKNAEKYLKLSLMYAKTTKDDHIQYVILSQTAVLNRLKGNSDQAISILLSLLATDSTKIDEMTKILIHQELAENYKAKKNIERENYYNKKYIKLLGMDVSTEKEAINKSLINLDKENASTFHFFQRRTYFIISLLVLVAGSVYIYQNIKILKTKKRYNEVLIKLEKKGNIPIVIKQNIKSTINNDKEREILGKLQKFEASTEFLSKNITLSSLSTKFKTNNTYLSEIINRHCGKNFTTYINELKIYYIVEKIKTDKKYKNYKISYLAEESGFISHSSFATTFKNVTGVTPSEFINLSKAQNS